MSAAIHPRRIPELLDEIIASLHGAINEATSSESDIGAPVSIEMENAQAFKALWVLEKTKAHIQAALPKVRRESYVDGHLVSSRSI